ncbi:MAG: hypothetical protein HUJ26_22970 [Planctomycetaceae bacterium]|nr:hypothetical protein [Planctomycetaceae bacterium]
MIPAPQAPELPKANQEQQEQRPLLFWGGLILTMGLYALILLSPRLAERELILADHESLQNQLIDDQIRLRRLREIEHSLKQDPELSHRILNGEKLIQQGDREIMPLSQGDLHSRESRQETSLPAGSENIGTVRSPHWYAPIVIFIGQHGTLRLILLLAVIVSILILFIWFPPRKRVVQTNEEEIQNDREPPRKPNFLERFKDRYQDSSGEDIDQDLERQLLLLTGGDNEWELDTLPVDEDEQQAGAATDSEKPPAK